MHNMDDESIEKKFEKAFEQASGGNPIFPYLAKQQMGKMVEEIAVTQNILSPDGGVLNTDQSYFIKGGNAAEEFHAHSFNLDAILKDSNKRALTDRRDGWSQHEWQGELLGKNANPDLIISDGGTIIHSAQMKYNKDATSTTGQMSQVKDGKIKYENNDSYIGPSEQVDGIKKQSIDNINKNLERNGDPVRREAYQQTHDKVKDRLSDGEFSSTPLMKEDANELGKGNLEKLERVGNEYQTGSTLQQMGKAAIGAAAMSAVVCGSVNIVRYIKMAKDGKISIDQAVMSIVKETVCSAADSAIKASANVGVQSLMVRYGMEKFVINALAKQGLGAMMRTNAVTVGVVCAIDTVKDLVLLGKGDISKEEFYERQGKNILNTSAGVLGGSLGFAAVGSVITSWGIGGAVAGKALLLAGGLSGGLIAGLAMTMAIENGIEKPYKNLLRNTQQLHEAALTLERVSQTIFMGQLLFLKYLEADACLEQQLSAQFDRIDTVGNESLDAIMKI